VCVLHIILCTPHHVFIPNNVFTPFHVCTPYRVFTPHHVHVPLNNNVCMCVLHVISLLHITCLLHIICVPPIMRLLHVMWLLPVMCLLFSCVYSIQLSLLHIMCMHHSQRSSGYSHDPLHSGVILWSHSRRTYVIGTKMQGKHNHFDPYLLLLWCICTLFIFSRTLVL